VLATLSLLVAAANAEQSGHAGTASRWTTAGHQGFAGSVGFHSRASTEGSVWAAEGSRARKLLQERRAGSASGLDGQTLGPIREVTVVVKGKAHDVVTNARTVSELLSAMRIEPDGDDEVAPPPDTPLSRTTRVRYTSISYAIENVIVRIPLAPDASQTSRVPVGYSQTLVPGAPAAVVASYRVRYVNGVAASRQLISTMVLRAGRPAHEVLGRAAHSMTGQASWYYVSSDLTAASPWLPFGTRVTVTNLATGATVTVVINDRGPFGGRIIDLSRSAFSRIAPLGQGVAEVRISW
jgi:rare lipoprotein A